MENYLMYVKFSQVLEKEQDDLKLFDKGLSNLFEKSQPVLKVRHPIYTLGNNSPDAEKVPDTEQTVEARLYLSKALKYLTVKRNGSIATYQAKINDKNAFDSLLDHLKSHQKIYEGSILRIPKEFPPLENYLGSIMSVKDDKKMLEHLMFASRLRNDSDVAVGSPYKLKEFLNFLHQEKFLETKFDEQKLQNWSSSIKSRIDINTLLQETNQLFELATQHNFIEKKKYVFNDQDNSLYIKEDGLVVSSQNAGFYIIKNNHSYTYYGYDTYEGMDKKHTNLSSLLKDIKIGNPNPLDTIVLKVQEGQIEFVDHGWISCMVDDFHNTLQSLKETHPVKKIKNKK